jgi:hypothetical protein
VTVHFDFHRDGWWAFAYGEWMAKLSGDPSPVRLGPFDTLAEAQLVCEQVRRDISQVPPCRRNKRWFLHSERLIERAFRHGAPARLVSE